METLTIQRLNIVGAGAFFIASLLAIWATPTGKRMIATPHLNFELPELHLTSQKLQARELLKRTPASISFEDAQLAQRTSKSFIVSTLLKYLPAAYKAQSGQIALALIQEANRHGLDPIFLMAVIKTESHFNPLAIGSAGEIGLMQILPRTADWVAKRGKMALPVNLKNPVTNIRIGAAHLAQLRKSFAQIGSRYISAYNMGSRNVHRLLQADIEPSIYATRVLNNYRNLYGKLSANVPQSTRQVASMN